MSKTKSIIVIGGGVAGLSSAGFLAKEGYGVRVLEANHKIGGSCATTNLKGYIFNDGAIYIVLPKILDHVFHRLGVDREAVIPMRRIMSNLTTMLPDGSVVEIGSGLDVTIERNGVQQTVSTMNQELEDMLRKWEPVLQIFSNELAIHPYSALRLIHKTWRHLGKFRTNVAKELTGLFSDPRLRSAMSGALLFTGLPPQKLPVSLLLGLVAMMTEGYYLPEGGMGVIPETLAQLVTQYGGEIVLNAKATRIVLRNGHVIGVEVDKLVLVANRYLE